MFQYNQTGDEIKQEYLKNRIKTILKYSLNFSNTYPRTIFVPSCLYLVWTFLLIQSLVLLFKEAFLYLLLSSHLKFSSFKNFPNILFSLRSAKLSFKFCYLLLRWTKTENNLFIFYMSLNFYDNVNKIYYFILHLFILMWG